MFRGRRLGVWGASASPKNTTSRERKSGTVFLVQSVDETAIQLVGYVPFRRKPISQKDFR